MLKITNDIKDECYQKFFKYVDKNVWKYKYKKDKCWKYKFEKKNV